MNQCIFTRPARDDLATIASFIGQYNPNAAATFIDYLRDRCHLLASNPHLGRARPELATELRSFPVNSYIVFYRPLSDGVAIVRFLHSARDIPRLFKPRVI
jgi:toxin ParE1/3/4